MRTNEWYYNVTVVNNNRCFRFVRGLTSLKMFSAYLQRQLFSAYLQKAQAPGQLKVCGEMKGNTIF